MTQSAKVARLEARLPQAVHKLLKRAAQLQGRTLSDFVVAAAQAAATRAVEEAQVVKLSLHDKERIARALSKPKAPAPALRRAFKRRRALLG